MPHLVGRPQNNDAGNMYDRHRHRPNQPAGHRLRDLPSRGKSTHAWLVGWLLLAAAVFAVAAGMGTGHGLVLAAGLMLAPIGQHLISAQPVQTHRLRRIPQPRDRRRPSLRMVAPGQLAVAQPADASVQPADAARPLPRSRRAAPVLQRDGKKLTDRRSPLGATPPCVPSSPRHSAAVRVQRRRLNITSIECGYHWRSLSTGNPRVPERASKPAGNAITGTFALSR